MVQRNHRYRFGPIYKNLFEVDAAYEARKATEGRAAVGMVHDGIVFNKTGK